MRIGVLALQGAIKEHISMLRRCSVTPIEIRLPEDLDSIDALIIPGGESTTLSRLMRLYGLDKEITRKARLGLPIYGTCAGAILMSRKILNDSTHCLGIMNISVKRNSYGRQIDSFESLLGIKYIGSFQGIFIRAPVIDSVHNGAEILSKHDGNIVMVRQNNLLASTFHPELTNDIRVHKYFIDIARGKI